MWSICLAGVYAEHDEDCTEYQTDCRPYRHQCTVFYSKKGDVGHFEDRESLLGLLGLGEIHYD